MVATGLAAVLVGLGERDSSAAARAVHRQVIVLSGIIPLLPGLTAYRGFYQLAASRRSTSSDGLVTIILALAIGLALAAGVTFGQFIVRPRPAPEISEPKRSGSRSRAPER